MKKWRPLYAANAGGGGGGETGTTAAGQGGTSPEGTAQPTLEGLLADETTRGLIAQYVAEQQAQWQQDAEAAAAEAARVAGLSAEERAEEERQRFAAERAQFDRERLEYHAVRKLADSKLPVQFAAQMVGKDQAATDANIEAFGAAWTEALGAAVTERIAGRAPASGGQPPERDGVTAAFLARNPGLKI